MALPSLLRAKNTAEPRRPLYPQHMLLTTYPGIAQLEERMVWDHEAASSSLATRAKYNGSPS